MGTHPRFFGQIDGATEMTRLHVEAMTKVLAEEQPDVLAIRCGWQKTRRRRKSSGRSSRSAYRFALWQ